MASNKGNTRHPQRAEGKLPIERAFDNWVGNREQRLAAAERAFHRANR